MNNTSELSRGFKGIWIPAQVWLDDRLTYFEKFLLCEIHSLDGKNGCFASNEYLCKFFKERERKIQSGICKLKNLGYVFQKSFDGRTRILKTRFPGESDNSLFNTSDTQEEEHIEKNDNSLFSTSEVLKSTPLGCRNPHPSPYIYNKEDNKEQQQEDIRNVSAAASSKCRIYPCLSDIPIHEKDKEQITSQQTEEKVIEAVKLYKSKKKRPDDIAAFINWAASNEIKSPEPIEFTEDKNKFYAEQLKKNIENTKECRLDILHKSVEFIYLTCQKDPIEINYSDSDFVNKIDGYIKKFGFKRLNE